MQPSKNKPRKILNFNDSETMIQIEKLVGN